MAQQNPWDNDPIVRPATAGNAPRVLDLPSSPREQRDEARRDAGEARDQIRTDIAQRGENRSETNDAFNKARSLREDFLKLPQVKDYQTVIRQYATALKTDATPTGDQALITAYAKMLDPGSVVREQEFSTVAAGDSAVGQMVAKLNKEFGADSAGLLRPEIRARIREEMQNLAANYNDSYNQARTQWGDIAQRNGVQPDEVVLEHFGAPYFNTIDSYYKDKRKGVQVPYDVAGEGLTGTVTDETPWDNTPAPRDNGGFQESLAGQGISGVNEGIANVLGFPVDLMSGGMNLLPRGLNAAANTDIPLINRPALGSEWIKDQMKDWAIYDPTSDPNSQFARRVGQSVGAASVPLAATANSARTLAQGALAALGGGTGAATANRFFPNNPLADFIGDVAGSFAVGGTTALMGRNAAQRQIEANIPTVPQLRDQASQLYRQAEARGVTASPQMTQDLADNLRGVLTREGNISPTGRISEVYPRARQAMQTADDYAGQPMNPTQMQTVRRGMADGLNSPEREERRLARMLTDEFDAWANPQAPELAQARQTASRYLAAEELGRLRNLAEARMSQFSGSGLENSMRTEYRGMDRSVIKGNSRFNADVEDAIERVSRGTPAANAFRDLGRLAPTGVVSSALGGGMGATVGGAIGGPAGALIGGTAVPAIGAASRKIAERMTLRAADLAELTARNGGAVPQAPLIDQERLRSMITLLAAQQMNAAANSNQNNRNQR